VCIEPGQQFGSEQHAQWRNARAARNSETRRSTTAKVIAHARVMSRPSARTHRHECASSRAPGGGLPSGIARSVQLIELVAQASSPCMTAVTCAAATHWLATFCDRFGRREAQAPVPVWYEAVMWVAMSAAEREEFLAGVVLPEYSIGWC
jgi:hypothetical protein